MQKSQLSIVEIEVLLGRRETSSRSNGIEVQTSHNVQNYRSDIRAEPKQQQLKHSTISN